LDLRRVEVDEPGSQLRFTLRLANPIPDKIASGKLIYRVFATFGDSGYYLALEIDRNGRAEVARCYLIGSDHNGTADDCSVSALVRAEGNTVTMYLPKAGVWNSRDLSWKAEAESDSGKTSMGEMRDIQIGRPMTSGIDLSAAHAAGEGGIFEIFHYPFVAKSRQRALKAIYSKVPGDDDFAIVVTDFRIDDIHNHGSSNGVSPVGNKYENLPEEQYAVYGSRKLQWAAGPIYLGPRFGEKFKDETRSWWNYPLAVGWMAHELTHRWSAYAQWTGADPQALLEAECRCHWSPFLNTPAVHPVSQLFTDKPYPEESQMGGMHAVPQPDGTTTGVTAPWGGGMGTATGLSALDLYFMGMIPAEDVPDTFVITGSVASENGGQRGGSAVPVRIADIIAAGGPRTPAAKEAQHEFTLGIYLLYEDGREPDAAKLAQARGIEAALAQYFEVATGGRMKVVTGW
jgi:hypothetical protein